MSPYQVEGVTNTRESGRSPTSSSCLSEGVNTVSEPKVEAVGEVAAQSPFPHHHTAAAQAFFLLNINDFELVVMLLSLSFTTLPALDKHKCSARAQTHTSSVWIRFM